MENTINKYIKHFKEEPVIIKFWRNTDLLINKLEKAIEDNKPYNEYDLLSKEEQKAFDDGSLMF